MEPVEKPKPFPWRELLHPGIEVIHALGASACFYLALVNWRAIPAPAFFRMEGYPFSSGWLITAFFIMTLVMYPFAFFGANYNITGSRPEAQLPEPQRKRTAMLTRLSAAVSTWFLAFICYTILLGIMQSSNGFDWNRRWPADGSRPESFYH